MRDDQYAELRGLLVKAVGHLHDLNEALQARNPVPEEEPPDPLSKVIGGIVEDYRPGGVTRRTLACKCVERGYGYADVVHTIHNLLDGKWLKVVERDRRDSMRDLIAPGDGPSGDEGSGYRASDPVKVTLLLQPGDFERLCKEAGDEGCEPRVLAEMAVKDALDMRDHIRETMRSKDAEKAADQRKPTADSIRCTGLTETGERYAAYAPVEPPDGGES